MKRPIFKDYKPEEINCAEDMSNWYESYAKDMDKYVDYLEAQSKSQESDSLPCVTQWVAVEDALPDTPWTTVNVLLKNGVVSSMIYSDAGEPWRWYNSSSRAQFPSETNLVVKWAKLPEPPCG